jgi:hypothetical protein
MKMLASIKIRVPDGRVARSLGKDGEFIAFSDFLDHLWIEALEQALGFLDGTVAYDLEQNFLLVLKRQRG